MASRPLPEGERGSRQGEVGGEAVFTGERAQLVPRGILHVDAGLASLLLANVLNLAGIEHTRTAFRWRRGLQISGELGHLFLEVGERAEGGDVEHGHEAPVVVPPRGFDAEAETGEPPAQNL